MNNILSSIQTLKSSEDCGKYSKRFLHKNLVGGTATTGTGRNQTLRLGECCVVKPLTAVGTLTSLLHNSAKVVEKTFQILSAFRLIKIVSLVVVLSISMVNESWATCENNQTCGDDCCWEFDNSSGQLTITGSGKMDNYGYDYKNRPWNSIISQITSLKVEGVTSIGDNAFSQADNIKNLDLPDVTIIGANSLESISHLDYQNTPKIEEIGGEAFYAIDSFIVPDTLTDVDSDAFMNTREFIISSDADMSSWHEDALADSGYVVFKCKGEQESCADMVREFASKSPNIPSENITCESASKDQCTGSDYGWSGTSCVYRGDEGEINCADSYVSWNNECYDEYPFAKKHWTPAEANKWLKDDDNFVVITFKK